MKSIISLILTVSLISFACEREKPILDNPGQNTDSTIVKPPKKVDTTFYSVTITLLNDTLVSSVEIESNQELVESIYFTYKDSIVNKTHRKGDVLIKSTYYLDDRHLAATSIDTSYFDTEEFITYNYFTYDSLGYLTEKISYPENIYFSGTDSSIISYYYEIGNQQVKHIMFSSGAENTWRPEYSYSGLAQKLQFDIINFRIGITGRLNRTLPYRYRVNARKGGVWDRRTFIFTLQDGYVMKRIDELYNSIVFYQSSPDKIISVEIFTYKYQ